MIIEFYHRRPILILFTEKLSQTHYARTYRHLRINVMKAIFTMLIMVVPSLIFFILNIDNITYIFSDVAVTLIGKIKVGTPINIEQTEFSILNTMGYVSLPTTYPSLSFIIINLVIVLVLFLCSGIRFGKPIAMYLTLGAVVHLINCIYFLFATNFFPYTATQYSELYMKQQIGIWLTFIVLVSLVVGFMGNKGFIYKLLTFVTIMAYSFLFGFVRYVLFLFIIQQYSILFMALMFFVFGPFFDFLYLVCIYGFFINKMVKIYDSEKGQEEWRW
ncbi:MAG: hypothetical protein PHX08_05525 [Lachnospiraceae bacterium]|nr:hypothetical protein [Lachnospiraceae bacterium]